MQTYSAVIAWADSPETVEDHLEVVSDAFNTALKGHGPAVGANLASGTLEAAFTVEVDENVSEVGTVEEILAVFARGVDASGLYPGDTEVYIERITAERVGVRELQPA